MQTASIIIIVVMIVGATVFALLRGSYAITPSLSDGAFSVSGPQDISYTVKFEDVAALQLLGEDFVKGEQISGSEKYGYAVGEYQNAAFGTYTLLTMTRLNQYIAVTSKDGRTLVFNNADNQTTVNFYNALKEHLVNLGYSFES